jgi:hypothetical protein
MWRILGLIGLLSACVSSDADQPKRQEMTGLKNMSLEYIQTQWGEPDYNLPRTTGRTVKFEGIESRDEDPVTGDVTVQTCRIRLDIDKEGLVDKWEYEECVQQNATAESTESTDSPDESDEDYDPNERSTPGLPDLEMSPADGLETD